MRYQKVNNIYIVHAVVYKKDYDIYTKTMFSFNNSMTFIRYLNTIFKAAFVTRIKVVLSGIANLKKYEYFRLMQMEINPLSCYL